MILLLRYNIFKKNSYSVGVTCVRSHTFNFQIVRLPAPFSNRIRKVKNSNNVTTLLPIQKTIHTTYNIGFAINECYHLKTGMKRIKYPSSVQNKMREDNTHIRYEK